MQFISVQSVFETSFLTDTAAVNPCEKGTDNCQQFCSSGNDGSFTCFCEAGYTLAMDGFSCNGEDP